MQPNISSKLDSELNLKSFFDTLDKDLKNIQSYAIEKNFKAISDAVFEFLADKIIELHPLKDFMANRMESELEITQQTVRMKIIGLKESEVNDKYSQKRDQNNDELSQDYDFFTMFEYGRPGGVLIVPQKAKALRFKSKTGEIVYARSVIQGPIYKYEGMVEAIIAHVKPELERFLESLTFEIIDSYYQQSLLRASKGLAKPSSLPVLKAKGGTVELGSSTRTQLANLGFNVLVRKSDGQISLRNQKGQFVKKGTQLKEILSRDENVILFKVRNNL